MYCEDIKLASSRITIFAQSFVPLNMVFERVWNIGSVIVKGLGAIEIVEQIEDKALEPDFIKGMVKGV
jgi:hypothetical protein